MTDCGSGVLLAAADAAIDWPTGNIANNSTLKNIFLHNMMKSL